MATTSASSTVAAGGASCGSGGLKYLSQAEAVAIDVDLMEQPGFTLDQLMELAGLSCAAATADAFPLARAGAGPSVLIVAGPGNNGGDGLVAARHMKHFGYSPSIVYPKPSPKFDHLVAQCTALGIPIWRSLPENVPANAVVLDALFGFSYRGPPRGPLADVLRALAALPATVPIVSIDIPSGWHVEEGPPETAEFAIRPSVLISLTAPKLGAAHFAGKHYLGGRFVPPGVAEKYGLFIPKYDGADQFVRLDADASTNSVVAQADTDTDAAAAVVVVVWITAPAAEAAELAAKIVTAELAACVNRIEAVRSSYMWDGELQDEAEVLLMAKTTRAHLAQLTAFVAAEHSYDVPETIAAQIVGGNADYMQWVADNVKPASL